MKSGAGRLIGMLMLAGAALAGCTPGTMVAAAIWQMPTRLAVPDDVPNSFSTRTPTATPTATLQPSPTPSPTPSASNTPLVFATPTPLQGLVFDKFAKSLKNGNAKQVVGVYVDTVLALRVIQQPSNNAGYVSPLPGIATYFAMVRQRTGNTGLLAHNYLAGKLFPDLKAGQMVTLIYGDGGTEEYLVEKSEEYQALNPTSPSSSFVNLANGDRLSATSLFNRVYGGSTRTTFQTCITQGADRSWGRLFVIAPEE